ncbi:MULTISPECIES: peroxidase-related enzyme [unclassified Bradyrhizobium]|uniref:carboxymuconolactone decarboxylase family protein n=1 Tax=unclassified Bradyrhizobium TaxID=2631580 RepID=UPI0028F01438|nr:MULTISPECIES: peroxidase-related enzyme [unclassified Bradyrhizobium]
MPRIAVVDTARAEAGVLATLSAVKAKIGMTPNLFSTFAQSPAVLNGYVAFSDALAKGALSAKQREIIALAVAQANGCEYCLAAHSLMGKGAGLAPDALRKARAGTADDATDAAVARFARRVLDTRGQVADADLAAARAAGLDDGRLLEIIANVAINVLTNYTNNAAQTVVDFPKVDVALQPV